MHKVWVPFIIMLFFCFNTINAQYYDSGQDPFSVKWRQIKTQQFQLIYPKELGPKAQRFANYLYILYNSPSPTLKVNASRLPVVIHNRTALSNGEVAWAPSRMNLFTVSPQDNEFQPWEQHLVAHEFRHVLQISRTEQRTTRVITGIFGEHAVTGIMGLFIPFWFLEGDAVAFETGVANAGRGRLPDFYMSITAQVEKKGIYSYPKAVFGSYRDYVPNRYELGYCLVAQMRYEYGADCWDKVLNQVASAPFNVNPFSKGIKKVTGMSERQWYQHVLLLSVCDSNLVKTKAIHKKESMLGFKSDYTNYYNPQAYSTGYLTYKTSLRQIPSFVFVDHNGTEKKLFQPGYLLNNTYSLSHQFLVWNELKYTRWENKSKSRVALYDLNKKKLKYLKIGNQVYSSQLSPSAQRIVSVETSSTIDWQMVIRDILGNELFTYSFDTLQPVQPSWNPSETKIVFVAIGNYGKSLGEFDLTTKQIHWIIKNEPIDFQYPVYLDNDILVKGVYQQKTNFYRFSSELQEWEVLTQEPYGVDQASQLAGSLLYSTYTADGYRVRSCSYTKATNVIMEKPEANYSVLADSLSAQEVDIDFSASDSVFNEEKYHRFAHLFRFHSWFPLAIDIDNMTVGSGVSIMSQNSLSTSFLNAGVQYYQAEQRPEFFLSYAYKGFYPELLVRYDYSPYTFYSTQLKRNFTYNQHEVQFSSIFPFVFDRASWYRRADIQLGYNYAAIFFDEKGYYYDLSMHSLAAALYLRNVQRTCKRDIYPRWGQLLYAQGQIAPFDENGYLYAVQGWSYFPGFLLNHSFRISGGHQEREDGTFGFNDKITYPRGYLKIDNTSMTVLRGEYTLPLLYPDKELARLVYLQRLRANLFSDNGWYYYQGVSNTQQSVGVEVLGDLYFKRFVAPIQLGLRYAYKTTVNDSYFGLLFQVNFSSLY